MSKKKPNIRKARGPARPQLLSRDEFVLALHRRPCGWDVVVCELCLALAEAYWAVRPSLKPGGLRIGAVDLPIVSLRLATAFDVALRRALHQDAPLVAAVDAGRVGTLAAEVGRRVARDDFDPLLRKLVEDYSDEILPRPDAELDRLVGRLEQAMAEVLATRCAPGGDLHAFAAAPLGPPLGPAGRALPDNGLRPDPAESSGSAARDIIGLAPTVHAEDDAADVKRKLVHFVRFDPWIADECLVYVADLAGIDAGWQDEESYRATDDFLLRATRLAGRTPIELFVERQPAMPEAQRRRLVRWNDEAFSDVFHLKKIESPFLRAADVRRGREYRLLATRPQVLKQLRRGDLVLTRAVPWDDGWVVSGVLEVIGNVDERGLPEVRRRLLQGPSPRRPDPGDPAVQKARAIMQEQYRAWVELFGADEMAFASGHDLQATLDRFYRHWNQERIDPETGMSRAQWYEREHNRPAPENVGRLPEDLLEARDVGVSVDPMYGIGFLTEFNRFRSALESSGRPTPAQRGIVLEYLRDESVEPVVFLKARQRHPQRLAELLSAALRDEQFDLERDFDNLVRKYKGAAMRNPQPGITVVE